MIRETLTAADLRRAGLQAESLVDAGFDNRDRTRAPLGVITHTPGEPFAAAALKAARLLLKREPTDLELDIAAATRFDAANYQPGYLIGVTGTVFQLDADHQRTQHAGELGVGCPMSDVYGLGQWIHWAKPSDGSGWQAHKRDGRVVFDWWFAAFPDADSPLDVFPWRYSPNAAIGIDLLPDPRHDYGFTEAQRAAWATLVRMLADLHGFPLNERRVTTHAFASPCERGTVRNAKTGTIYGTHWDPPVRHWDNAAMIARARGPA